MPSFASLFPPNTIIKDFAYSSSHPLRLGNFEVYENNSDDDYDDDYSYHDDDQSPDEINRRAVALFDFTPENDNEVKLVEGQVIWISYRHGQGWLVAEDPATGENGLVPEEYVEVFDDDDLEADGDGITSPNSTNISTSIGIDPHDSRSIVGSNVGSSVGSNTGSSVGSNVPSSQPDDDAPKPFLPGILRHNQESDSDWVDTEYEDEEDLVQQLHKAKLDEQESNLDGERDGKRDG